MAIKISIKTFNHKLNHPFTISRHTYSHTQSMVVSLSEDGFSGFGEATFNPYYPNTDIGYMTDRINSLTNKIAALSDVNSEMFWQLMHEFLHDCPFALCALDQAFLDLQSRKEGMKLYDFLGLQKKSRLENCYTLSIDSDAVMIDRMKRKPWAIYKIKLGTDRDIDMVEAIRQHTNAEFWVDANCAWNVDDTIRKSKELKKLGVTLIEQPLAADQWEEMEEVYHKTSVQLLADECCKTIDDIAKCEGKFHGINIKVMKCGGLTPALKMIHEGRSKNLKIMVGCMAESTVGISAIAHLSSLIDFADMDGQHFISDDPATGVLVNTDGIIFSDLNGSGVKLIG